LDAVLSDALAHYRRPWLLSALLILKIMQIIQMTLDPLSSLLAHFRMRAGTFFNGELCGSTPQYGTGHSGQLHLLRSGSLELQVSGQRPLQVERPSLLFFPRPLPHRLRWRQTEPMQLVCANLEFEGGANSPLAAALPEQLVLSLNELPELSQLVDWLCREAGQAQPGQNAALDRLFELLVIQLLRREIQTGAPTTPLLAGLADPQLARALDAIHRNPAHAWDLPQLAALAHMSRSRFAQRFQQRLACTPGEYLLGWRAGLVRQGLLQGKRIGVLAESVGYQSPAALTRAFRRHSGLSPRDWLRSQQNTGE
jgi:AraC-like DNA-binding protein